MNECQVKALCLAKDGHSFRLIGLPGTGKTAVTREIVTQLRLNGKIVGLTAATGTACQQYSDAVTEIGRAHV